MMSMYWFASVSSHPDAAAGLEIRHLPDAFLHFVPSARLQINLVASPIWVVELLDRITAENHVRNRDEILRYELCTPAGGLVRKHHRSAGITIGDDITVAVGLLVPPRTYLVFPVRLVNKLVG